MDNREIKKPVPPAKIRTGELTVISTVDTNNIVENQEKSKEKRENKEDFWSFYDFSRFDELENPNVFDGWVVEGGINVLFSDAGKGKSYLATSLCLKIAKQNSNVKVFYIDLDNPVVLPKARHLPEVVRNLNINNFYYINSLFFDDIEKEIEKRGLNYKNITNKIIKFVKLIDDTTNCKVIVVFDSLQNFINTNEIKDVDTALDFMKRHTDKFTYILIHHINKIGQFKGLTTIRDKADSFYTIDNVDKDIGGYIQSQVIKADKRRFLTEETVTYRYTDLFSYELIDFSISKEDEIVLRVAVSQLMNNKMKQKDLVNAISSKVNVGRNKIFATLKNFEGRLFNVAIGVKNTRYYSINDKSEILSFLKKDINPVKQNLLDLVKTLEIAYGELSSPISFELHGKLIEYKTFSSIKNNIFSMKQDEAEEVLEILSERYQD